MKRLNRGFTLIELLVVVAIIGILASVVLASLNSARTKGSDAAIKAAMANARAQAELFYDVGQTYEGVCAASGTNVIGPMILNAAQKLGSAATVELDTQGFVWSTAGLAGTLGDAICHDLGTTGWAAQVSLKGTTNMSFCVDSAGAAKETTTAIAANAVACP